MLRQQSSAVPRVFNCADYKPEGSSVAGHATKSLSLYRLPLLLVLHLKRFAYTGSIVKNHK